MFWWPCYVWFLCCFADGVWVLTNGNGVMPAFVGCKFIPCLFWFGFICCACEAFVSYFAGSACVNFLRDAFGKVLVLDLVL